MRNGFQSLEHSIQTKIAGAQRTIMGAALFYSAFIDKMAFDL